MSRIFLTGDTHGHMDISKLSNKKFPQHNTLTKDDYVIVLGDFGLVWDESPKELWWRNWLEERNFTTLFTCGNHENFDLLEQYPVENWNGGKIHRISNSIIHLMRGQVYSLHGKSFFAMGGAASIDRANRTEGKSWWKQEIPSYAEYNEGIDNLEKYNWKVDYILTHTAPARIIERMGISYRPTYDRSLELYLSMLIDKVEFKEHFFGHMHHDFVMDKHMCLYREVVEIG